MVRAGFPLKGVACRPSLGISIVKTASPKKLDSEPEYRRDCQWARLSLSLSLSGLQGRGPHARARASASGRMQLERSPQTAASVRVAAAADVVESTRGLGRGAGGLLLLAQQILQSNLKPTGMDPRYLLLTSAALSRLTKL